MLQAGNQYATSVESWGAERTGAREPVLHFFIERYRQAYTSEVDSFVSSLEQGRPMSPDFGDGLQALRLAVAADESLRTGQVVDLD
jgi:myo-inositol 2-dehydrogenase/D-chiro-inositol 1-dehydrogenase